MKNRFLYLAMVSFALLGLAFAITPSRPGTAARQIDSGWDSPVNLSNSETQSTNPSMAVDPSGVVHVVWSEETEDGRSFISYAQLSEGNWSPANEIAGSPNTEIADYPTLVADANGYLHLVWRGDATLYYSRAYAPQAGEAQSWSPPAALEYIQDNIGRPHLQIDSVGVLHLVYPILLGSESGIYYMKSSDGGLNWSDPTSIYNNRRADRSIDMPRLAVSAAADGRLHVVWVESDYPETFPPIGIRYSSSSDGGETWSEATSLADGPYSFPEVITRGSDEVHMVYSGTGGDRYKFHRWSADSGTAWEEVYRNTEVGGYQGLPALVVDSADQLHLLTTASVFQIGIDSIYHTVWQDGTWLPGEVLLRGEAADQNPWDVAAAVALGNELHVAVQNPLDSNNQPEGWQNEIYYLHQELSSNHTAGRAIALPTVIIPEPTLSATQSADSEIHPTLTRLQTQPAETNLGQVGSLVAGVLAAFALVVGVFALARRGISGR